MADADVQHDIDGNLFVGNTAVPLFLDGANDVTFDLRDNEVWENTADGALGAGIVVVGGVFFSTFFTLILVPVAYSFLARFSRVEDAESVDVEKAAATG